MYPYQQTGPTADPSLAHRRAASSITLTRPDGTPLSDTEVVVEQRRHEFGFAASAFEFIPFVTGDLNAESHALHERVAGWRWWS